MPRMAAVLIAVFLLPAAAAVAQTPVPAPLTGETFAGSTPLGFQIVAAQCNPAGQSSFTYESRGQAAGPYPGTYFERGTFVIGPQPGSIDLATGPVLSHTATFRIDSAAGAVTGTKSLAPVGTPLGGCRENEPLDGGR